MIILENLTIHSTIDLHHLLDDLTLVINKGDKVAVIGEEGNGKSTLLKLLYFGSCSYANFSGNFSVKGKVCYLPQELEKGALNQTVEQFFAKTVDFFDIDAKKLGIVAKTFNFPTDIFWSQKTLKEFSGGERVKIQLLCLALSNADVFLLDEPSNDIDLKTLSWLEQFISTSNATVLFISHDQTLLENTANVILHLEQTMKKSQPISTIFRGGYKQYIDYRLNTLARQQQMHNKETQQFNTQLEKYRRIFQSVEHAQNTVSPSDPATGRLLKKKMHAVKALEKRLDKKQQEITPKTDVEKAIELEFEKTDFPRGKTVLDFKLSQLKMADQVLSNDISLNVFGGEKVAIIGQNGCGKTTLLKEIFHQLKNRRDLKVGYMPQNYADQMDFSSTAVDFLANSTGHEKTFVRRFLGSANFTSEEMLHEISMLSGGQKAKLYFLSMILNKCNCLLLDEPTRNFSPLSAPVIQNALKTFDGTVIAVSHDRALLKIFDKTLALTKNGLMQQ